ncbi:hypothetical protein TRIATDRAFT_149895 [Trichoderma atroviride IMI 206040]|uniref:Uncharacterized protein n=1 Tax=Hypocrea atroviridis (strain ATCC 20476 / IMI 206040) TaxID=452589 RepID=G9P1T0_HYPAI|nr:uncharacterized protein TRIATDRAFT_149895 [Trichoderma atroviride IMI 206040]EHK42579.1 hypothetical protein TRIATDRAFT_149895 [Trichoderma atroviride IMI 206040]
MIKVREARQHCMSSILMTFFFQVDGATPLKICPPTQLRKLTMALLTLKRL